MLSYFYLFIVFISCFSYCFKDHCLSLFLGFLTAFELDVIFSVGRIKKGLRACLGSGKCGERIDSSLLMANWV